MRTIHRPLMDFPHKSWVIRNTPFHGMISSWYTVRCRYNPVNFIKKNSPKTSQSSPVRASFGVSFVYSAFDWYLSQFRQWCMQCLVILDRVITALQCTMWYLTVSSGRYQTEKKSLTKCSRSPAVSYTIYHIGITARVMALWSYYVTFSLTF